MSDFRAIAGVTAALQQLLDGPASAAVPGATVRAGPPSSDPVAGAGGMVNIFLYQVTPNPSWRNAELPVRREDGTLIRRPQAALDLHYLLSFFGEETKMVPQLLLGATVSALHAQPTLGRQDIPRELAGKSFLDSGLHEQAELLQFVPTPMTYDEISRLWSIFQVPYSLSVAYRCQVVLIEADLDPEPALPTRSSRVTITLGWPAQIDRVVPQVLEVADGARLRLEGRHLAADGLGIRVDGTETRVRPVTEHVVEIEVPSSLAAGVHTVRPVRFEAPRAVSNPASFVLLPKIVGPIEVVEIAASESEGNGEASRALRVPILPKVEPEEPVALLLHELPVPEGRAPRRHSLRSRERTEATDVLEFPAPRVEPGEYLVRVEVNRVASLLSVDEDPESPDFGRYNGPKVSIL